MSVSGHNSGASRPKPVVNKPRGLAAIALAQPALAKSVNLDRSGAQKSEARQVRAARALLDWSEAETAEAAGITVAALSKVERGSTPLQKNTMTAVQKVFSAAGVVLLHPGDGPEDGVGVRLRKADP